MTAFAQTPVSKETQMKSTSDPYELIKSEAYRCKAKGECGWWFGFVDPMEEEKKKKELEEQEQAKAPIPETEEERCSKADTWTDDCGWVDPKRDFEFMEKMRDQLAKNALMYSDQQEHIKQYQKFMLWLVDSAISYSKVWEYNMMQDQSLNPFVRHPVSTFGLRAAVRTRGSHLQSIFSEIKEQGGYLVFFTRSDCTYCYVQAPIIKELASQTKIPVVNVSLDSTCMAGYKGENCITADEEYILEAMTAIGINVVPDLFLFLPKDNHDNKGWIRVSTGSESVTTIKRRIRMFFEGVRSASIAGLDDATNSFKDQKRPNVTFDTKHNKDYEPGTTFRKKPDEQGAQQ